MFFLLLSAFVCTYIIIELLILLIPKGQDMHKTEKVYLPEFAGIAVLISFFVHIIRLSKAEKYLAVILIAIYDDVIGMRWDEKIIYPGFFWLINESSKIRINTECYKNMNFHLCLNHIYNQSKFYVNLNSYILQIFDCSKMIFSCNAINILSGVNGIEISQVICIVFSLYVLTGDKDLLIFLISSIPLLIKNFFPSKVFIGNSYLIFAGYIIHKSINNKSIVFALQGLQLVNFIISIPQLIGIYPCPRHRMPAFSNGFLIPSVFIKNKLKYRKNHLKQKTMNFTLLNFILVLTGPLKERTLLLIFIVSQIIYCSTFIVFLAQYFCHHE